MSQDDVVNPSNSAARTSFSSFLIQSSPKENIHFKKTQILKIWGIQIKFWIFVILGKFWTYLGAETYFL